MDTKRKILLVTRHGVRPIVGGKDADTITLESALNMYENAGGSLRHFIQGEEVTPDQAFLKHTEKKRTLHTGNAIYRGAFDLSKPVSVEDLSPPAKGIVAAIDPRLDFKDLKFNEKALMANDKEYLQNWISNPYATDYEDVPITPFNSVVQSSRGLLHDSLGSLISGGKKLGMLSNHGGVIESLAVAAVNSARHSPIESADDIGGLFDKEGYFQLVLDHNPATGSYTARLERNGQTYKVDLQNLMN